jgi:hypothetical protein
MNLDTLCAHYGYKIVQRAAAELGQLPKDKRGRLENTVTKALSVLQEDGVYAMFLFLDYFKDRGESHGAGDAFSLAIELLRNPPLRLLRGRNRANAEQDDFPGLADLGEDLDRLLLACKLLEQTLIYARYHAKALPTASGGGE